MPIPTIPEKDSHDGRNPVLLKPEWTIDVTNWREVSEALVAYSDITGSYAFIGTAECKLDGTIRQLIITLCFDEEERVTCSICHRVPARPTFDNPGICVECGQKVCAICRKRHEQEHWRPPVKTIGGERIPF